ncbi:MAG: DUF2577 domain-containing protein [Hungatella sp.]|nr:DUF2577 domain-containing protein [Hungatella sp.]
MPDAVQFVKTMKKAAVEAVEATKPVYIYFGEVISVSPLKISVDQKMILGESLLILSRNVKDFKTTITVNWSTENKSGGSGDSSFASHNHGITGKKEITVHNGLVVGDAVLLFRKQGGQKFIVFDKV